MTAKPGLQIAPFPVRTRRRLGPMAKAAVAAAAIAALAACATMDSIAKRTAESPSESWTPPAREAKPPAPPPAPQIPADLQAPGKAWTLPDIVDVGLANNPQTRATWNAARAASAAVSLSLGGYLPTVQLSATGAKLKAAFAGGQFIIDQTTLNPVATLNLLLFDFGGREASVQTARRALDAANWTHNAVIQNVLLDIESTYYQYLAARALLEAQETSRTSARANHEAATERHKAGVATIADVLQAKTVLSAVELELVTTRGLIQTLHGALANAMGLPADASFDVAEELPAEIPLESVSKQVDVCIRDAEAKRPDLAAARSLVLEAEAGVRKARSTFFPSFSLSGNAGRIYYLHKPVSNPTYTVSLSVNLPFLFGLQQYAVLAAKAQAEVARDQMAELSRGIALEVWTSYYGLKTAEQKISNAKDLMASAEASYNVALGRYKEGVGSVLDLLSAQTLLEGARVQLVQAKSDWFQALIQFTHDTGALVPPAAPTEPIPSPSLSKGDHRP
jgi:outer membrane protein